MTSKPAGRPVLITTKFRGVFFGYSEDTTGDTVVLSNARNCISWPSSNGGFGYLKTRAAQGHRHCGNDVCRSQGVGGG